MTKTLPFPWDPNGPIPAHIEHLFRPVRKKYDQSNRDPASYRTPGPACQFTIGTSVPVAMRKKKLLTRI